MISAKWTTYAALVALAITLVVAVRSCSDPDPLPVVLPDTVSAAAWKARVAELEAEKAKLLGERDGLRGLLDDAARRIRGLEQRPPRTVTVYDTMLLELDTVQLAWSIEDGRLDVIGAVPVENGHQPIGLGEIDVRDCDDGVRTAGLRIICDRAALGHLSLVARGVLGASLVPRDSLSWRAELGVRWKPSFRSSTAFELVGTNRRRLEVRADIGFLIF